MTTLQAYSLGLLFFVGWVCWWGAEYILHRFVGHGRSNRLDFAKHHKKHHAIADHFAPATEKLKITLMVGGGLMAVTSYFSGLFFGGIFTSGFVLSYLSYEWLHRRAHSHPPKSKYGRWLRRHHFYHHFMNPALNHGVTTSIGDWIFGTNRVPEKIRVPEKLKMVWLTDPATNEVWPEFSGDYELVRLNSR